MTVAAVILSATAADALLDTFGQPRVRRLADLAWSGGAMPIVVVAPDPDGTVAAALVGSEAVLGSPATTDTDLVGQIGRGAEVALAEVRDTTAILVWPARMTWVGPETVTSLIEAHGMVVDAILRPAWHGEPGWPVLVPTIHLDALAAIAAERAPADVIDELARTIASRAIDVGDPGVIHDADTAATDLPAYEGPPDPPAGHRHEWGVDVAEEAGLPDPR